MLRADIRLRPRSSKTLAFIFLVVWGFSLAVVLVLPLPWQFNAGLAAVVLAYGILSYRDHCLRQGDIITEVSARVDGGWEVTTRHKNSCPGELAPDSLVLPWLTVLNFKLADGRRRSVVLLPDNVDAETFRKLRIRLRFPGPEI